MEPVIDDDVVVKEGENEETLMEPDQLMVCRICQEIIKQMPDKDFFDNKKLVKQFPVSITEPFNSVLV